MGHARARHQEYVGEQNQTLSLPLVQPVGRLETMNHHIKESVVATQAKGAGKETCFLFSECRAERGSRPRFGHVRAYFPEKTIRAHLSRELKDEHVAAGGGAGGGAVREQEERVCGPSAGRHWPKVHANMGCRVH